MPLESRSRLTRTPTPPSEPKAGVDLNTSPRRRGSLSRAAAESDVPPRTDTLDEQEEAAQEEASEEAPVSAPPHKAATKTGKKRGPKPKPELPPDAAKSDDPAVLRQVLKNLETEAAARRKAFDQEMKDLRTQFSMVSAKLAELL